MEVAIMLPRLSVKVSLFNSLCPVSYSSSSDSRRSSLTVYQFLQVFVVIKWDRKLVWPLWGISIRNWYHQLIWRCQFRKGSLLKFFICLVRSKIIQDFWFDYEYVYGNQVFGVLAPQYNKKSPRPPRRHFFAESRIVCAICIVWAICVMRLSIRAWRQSKKPEKLRKSRET